MYQYLPCARYNVLKQAEDIKKSDNTKIGTGHDLHKYSKMWDNSVSIIMSETKNFNVRSHPEFKEHPHRNLFQTKPPYSDYITHRDTELVETFIDKEKGKSTHGVIENDGLNFFKY